MEKAQLCELSRRYGEKGSYKVSVWRGRKKGEYLGVEGELACWEKIFWHKEGLQAG